MIDSVLLCWLVVVGDEAAAGCSVLLVVPDAGGQCESARPGRPVSGLWGILGRLSMTRISQSIGPLWRDSCRART
jgi:hypothetical protein